jgi:hypothetical protein
MSWQQSTLDHEQYLQKTSSRQVATRSVSLARLHSRIVPGLREEHGAAVSEERGRLCAQRATRGGEAEVSSQDRRVGYDKTRWWDMVE